MAGYLALALLLAGASGSQEFDGCVTGVTKDAIAYHIEGIYENHVSDQEGKNDWHYVSISRKEGSDGRGQLVWKNKAGVEWSLTVADASDKTSLVVGPECPYYEHSDGRSAPGYTVARVEYDEAGRVTRVRGPAGEWYDREGKTGRGQTDTSIKTYAEGTCKKFFACVKGAQKKHPEASEEAVVAKCKSYAWKRTGAKGHKKGGKGGKGGKGHKKGGKVDLAKVFGHCVKLSEKKLGKAKAAMICKQRVEGLKKREHKGRNGKHKHTKKHHRKGGKGGKGHKKGGKGGKGHKKGGKGGKGHKKGGKGHLKGGHGKGHKEGGKDTGHYGKSRGAAKDMPIGSMDKARPEMMAASSLDSAQLTEAMDAEPATAAPIESHSSPEEDDEELPDGALFIDCMENTAAAWQLNIVDSEGEVKTQIFVFCQDPSNWYDAWDDDDFTGFLLPITVGGFFGILAAMLCCVRVCKARRANARRIRMTTAGIPSATVVNVVESGANGEVVKQSSGVLVTGRVVAAKELVM